MPERSAFFVFQPVQVHVSHLGRTLLPIDGMVMHQPKRRAGALFFHVPRREQRRTKVVFPAPMAPWIATTPP